MIGVGEATFASGMVATGVDGVKPCVVSGQNPDNGVLDAREFAPAL